MSDDGRWESADVLVLGAGVLGVSIAYWISTLYDCRILLVDKERSVAAHTSSRNTGVMHRPFYLNPETKKVFARSSQLSYPMWRAVSRNLGLPWKGVGTLSVAVRDEDVGTLEEYVGWAEKNGVQEDEIELLDGSELKSLEPEVECRACLYSRTDASVDFGGFTRTLHAFAASNGVLFRGGLEFDSSTNANGGLKVRFRKNGGLTGVVCKLFVNAAGGGALEIAHSLGLATRYASLNFRGDYWVVGEPFASKVRRNIYTPPRYPEFPFLDPHFVVRTDGSRQIGPNAALVTGPYVYRGVGLGSPGRLFSPPLGPKLRLVGNTAFLSMAADEWRSSLFKTAMCERVRKFIPALRAGMLTGRGLSGVRSSIVDQNGFVPEALLVHGLNSIHILNYNSPGATGAPAYSAYVLARMAELGLLGPFQRRRPRNLEIPWDYEAVVGAF